MELDTNWLQEKNVDKNVEDQANKEYRELLSRRTKMVMQRDEELKRKKLPVGLDGPNYYQDIDSWFDAEFLKLKKKVQLIDDES